MFGYTKQAFYKRSTKKSQSKDYLDQVKQEVMKYRSLLPKLGGRKLHYLMQDFLSSNQIKMGRDQLFKYLRESNLLVSRKQKYHKTTNSKHWMRKYPNCVKGLHIHRPEQVWVADITYLTCNTKHHYLHLITDAYSKRIVGYKLSNNMQAETTVEALEMALKGRIYDEKLIHHSDRGLQYCSQLYTKILNANDIKISMTEQADPYENAIAERVNGILKDEFLLDIHFGSKEIMETQVKESIALYNQTRPHFSIGLLTPNQAHLQQKVKLKKWKKKTHLQAI
ncbi:transposase [Flammeovirga pacifica]|uniref:Transposase n=1 Tax=Flammeovirga pacifica TaxID=915059 RepID=A0A1S1YV32_FLAPC|nr:transposase [Flammeovirga pacifica]OHX64872.1 transposase [Flammeovirga pacifica]